MSEYGARIRRRARIARVGRALFFLFFLGGLVFAGVRAHRALRGGASVAGSRSATEARP